MENDPFLSCQICDYKNNPKLKSSCLHSCTMSQNHSPCLMVLRRAARKEKQNTCKKALYAVVLKLVFSDNISSKWITWLDVLAAGRQLAKQNKTRQMQKWVRDKNGLFVQRKSHLIPPDLPSSTQNLGKISRAFWFLKSIHARDWSNMISTALNHQHYVL